MPNLGPRIPLFAKIDLFHLAPYHLQPCVSNCVTSEKDDCAKFYAELATQCLIFYKKFCKVIIFWYLNISKRRVANVTDSNRLNLFSQKRKIMEQALGNLFIISNSSHFFNKTDLEQYLFNV